MKYFLTKTITINKEDIIFQSTWIKPLQTLKNIIQKFKIKTLFVNSEKLNCSTREYVDFNTEIHKIFDQMDIHFAIIKNKIILLTDPKD